MKPDCFDYIFRIFRGRSTARAPKASIDSVAGSGMADPNVLETVGYDSEKYTGYAFGIGIERMAMVRHRIPDIRFLYDGDVRFLHQF